MYLSLCLIAKDENSYLQEWLDYHILLGVEHFWIYDNESAVPISSSLSEYIDQGWVTVNMIKGKSMQMFAYDHCVQTYQHESKWIGFIDTDEFIVLHTPELLSTFLTRYEPYGGLAISSLFFGHGGNKTRPKGGQIAGFRYRTSEQFSNNRLVKMIVQPERVIFPKDPHTFLFKEPFFAINDKGRRVDTQLFPCQVDTIQLNHYFTRSAEEWMEKKNRGKVASTTPYLDNRWLEVNNSSTVEDTRIYDHLKRDLTGIANDRTSWSKITHRNSRDLIDLLHKAIENRNPSINKQFETSEIIPRPEHIAYFNETKMGLKLIEEGKLVEARDLYASHINRFPTEITGYTNFAAACFQQEDFQSAWPALAEAWRIAPQSLAVLIGMTDYFYAIGDFAQAEKTSLLAATQGDLTPVGITVLALSQWKQGKIDEAIASAKPIRTLIQIHKTQNPLFIELDNLLSHKI
jgi:hypothetical protein